MFFISVSLALKALPGLSRMLLEGLGAEGHPGAMGTMQELLRGESHLFCLQLLCLCGGDTRAWSRRCWTLSKAGGLAGDPQGSWDVSPGSLGGSFGIEILALGRAWQTLSPLLRTHTLSTPATVHSAACQTPLPRLLSR